MVDVDNMSDGQLRAKLIEFGFPVMPITGTTRKTMMKKLKVLLENQKKTGGRDSRRSLGRYSSEDESDADQKTAKKNKRATMAAPPTPLQAKVSLKRIPDEPPVQIKTSTVTTKRTTQVLHSRGDEFDTGSESDEVADRFEPRQSPQVKLPSSFHSASVAADTAAERISQIRSRFSTYSPLDGGYERPLYTSSPRDDLLNDKESTPFLSNFTRRLSQLKESPSRALDGHIKENDTNGGAASPTARTYLDRATRGRPSTFAYAKPANQNILKNNFVPITVLIVAFLFFIVVAVVYLGIRSDTSLQVSAKVPVCHDARPDINCVLEGEGKAAIDLFNVLKPELLSVALRHQCSDSRRAPFMTEEEIVQYMLSNFAVKDTKRIRSDLRNLEILSFLNPNWQLSVVQVPHSEDTSHHIPKDMEQVNSGRDTKKTALMATPYIPWSCYLYNSLWACLNILSSLIGGVLLLFAINYTYKEYKSFRIKQQEEEIAMVENIIETLQQNCEVGEDNYMVINHVRDMLLPIAERKGKQKLWERAVEYINTHESRIRTEERIIADEPSDVWRWLGGPNVSSNKSWQGQAFETQSGSVNSLQCSPTPCLKIRGMVEEGDRNTGLIKKAVLGKCASECKIVHCGVDIKSKCVYLKCADTGDAAVAYRNLHGWWYSGHLVTVKYLRLERYMQRFPDSPLTGPPFL